MSNQDRTPGPWVVKDDGIVAAVTPADCGDIICEAPEGFEDSMRRWRANAEFIVRVVNAHDALLEACEACETDLDAAIKRLPQKYSDRDDYQACVALLAQVRAAIADAEGAREQAGGAG